MQHVTPAELQLPAAIRLLDQQPDSVEVRVPVVAAMFGCSISTIWRRVRSGDMPQPRRRGGVSSWPLGELRKTQAAA